MNTVKKLQDLSENRPWLTFLVLVTLGTMILFCLGCGSGSAPESKKPEKTAKSSGAMKSQAAMPLLSDKEGVGETRKVKRSAGAQRIEIVPGYTQEELDAMHAEQRKQFEASDIGVAPGMTKAQMEAMQAEQRKQFTASDEYRQMNARMGQQSKPEGREWFPPSAGK